LVVSGEVRAEEVDSVEVADEGSWAEDEEREGSRRRSMADDTEHREDGEGREEEGREEEKGGMKSGQTRDQGLVGGRLRTVGNWIDWSDGWLCT
jgi:hypothetical protein